MAVVDRDRRQLQIGSIVVVYNGGGRLNRDEAQKHHGKLANVIKLDNYNNSAKVVLQDDAVCPFDPLNDTVWFVADMDLARPRTLESTASDNHDASNMYERLFEDSSFKDVAFRLVDGEVRAHKSVLAAASNVFSAMFSTEMKESATGVIDVLDTKRVHMQVFLRLLYTDCMEPADWLGDRCSRGSQLPLDILAAVVSLARKYMVERVAASGVEDFKKRIEAAKASSDAVTFEQILATAISMNLDPVRFFALKVAGDFEDLRVKYDQQKLQPTVQAELQAVWSPPPCPQKKRMRLG